MVTFTVHFHQIPALLRYTPLLLRYLKVLVLVLMMSCLSKIVLAEVSDYPIQNLSQSFNNAPYTANLPGFGDWFKRRNHKPFKKKKNNQNNTNYLEIGGGYGIWYQSNQIKMEPYQNPIEAFIGYGRTNQPLSYQLGISSRTSFAQEVFVLKPTVFFAGIKYSAGNLLTELPQWVDPYVVGGLTLTRAILTDRVYPGIVNYEFKEEKDQRIGAYAGAGISFKYRNFYFGPQFTYYISGNGQYLAGAFEKQNINMSTMTVTVRITYRFRLRSNKILCPSYL